jgi:hypothetical protein
VVCRGGAVRLALYELAWRCGVSITLCTLNRAFLEMMGMNLYTILFTFRNEQIDRKFHQAGKYYLISSIELADDKIVAFAQEVSA